MDPWRTTSSPCCKRQVQRLQVHPLYMNMIVKTYRSFKFFCFFFFFFMKTFSIFKWILRLFYQISTWKSRYAHIMVKGCFQEMSSTDVWKCSFFPLDISKGHKCPGSHLNAYNLLICESLFYLVYILRKFEVQVFIILNGLTIKIQQSKLFVFFKVNFEFNKPIEFYGETSAVFWTYQFPTTFWVNPGFLITF